MFAIPAPIGWDKSFKDNLSNQEAYFKAVTKTMNLEEFGFKLFFNDFLDQITLYYTIKMELHLEEIENGEDGIVEDDDLALKIEESKQKMETLAKSSSLQNVKILSELDVAVKRKETVVK